MQTTRHPTQQRRAHTNQMQTEMHTRTKDVAGTNTNIHRRKKKKVVSVVRRPPLERKGRHSQSRIHQTDVRTCSCARKQAGLQTHNHTNINTETRTSPPPSRRWTAGIQAPRQCGKLSGTSTNPRTGVGGPLAPGSRRQKRTSRSWPRCCRSVVQNQ